MVKTVFLGGTCAGPDYRKELIPMLRCDYFNPVVDNWTEADAQRENEAKLAAAINLFVLTPAMIGAYSVAELVEEAMLGKRIVKLLFLEIGDLKWNEHQRKSNVQIERLVAKYGVDVHITLDSVALSVNTLLR